MEQGLLSRIRRVYLYLKCKAEYSRFWGSTYKVKHFFFLLVYSLEQPSGSLIFLFPSDLDYCHKFAEQILLNPVSLAEFQGKTKQIVVMKSVLE